MAWTERREGWTDEGVASDYDARRFEGPMQRRKHANDVRLVRGLLARVGDDLHVLDAPTGTGRMVQDLLDAGHRVTGIDLSEPMLRQAAASRAQDLAPGWDSAADRAAGCAAEGAAEGAAKGAAEGAAEGAAGQGGFRGFLSGEIERLPFRDDAFDAVISLRFLFHAKDPEVRARLLGEFRRVSPWMVGHVRSRENLKHAGRWLRSQAGLSRRYRPAQGRAELQAELASCGWDLVASTPVSRVFSDKVLFLAKRQAT